MDEDSSSDLQKKRSRKDTVDDMVMTKQTDLISQLPDHIVHHILSFLPKRDVALCSLLSKTWHAFWTTFPVSDLEFCQPLIYEPDSANYDKISLEYARFVHDSVLRQHQLNTRIQRFKLSMSCDHCSAPSIIYRSLGRVILCGVKELDLDLKMCYYVPSVILSAKSLVVLRLATSNFMLDGPIINWPSLRELSMHSVDLNRQILQNLHLTCPQLEKFSVVDCSMLESVELSGLAKLKKVKIKAKVWGRSPLRHTFDIRMKKLKIDVPSLQILNLRVGNTECKIDVSTCVNLQVLKLKSPSITERACEDLVSNLHDLKVLVLRCPLLRTINVPNTKLEKIEFSSKILPQAAIHTPRLRSLKYRFDWIRILGLVDRRSLQKVSIKLFDDDLFPYYFCKLREHLVDFNQIKHLILDIKSRSIEWRNPEVYFPVNIKHLKLKLSSSLRGYHDGAVGEKSCEALVDGLLWMCHPESLFLKTGWGSNNEIVTILCRKLMHVERSQVCKCWQHDLKGIEIHHYNGNGVRKALSCVDLLESLQTLAPKEKIFFLFKW